MKAFLKLMRKTHQRLDQLSLQNKLILLYIIIFMIPSIVFTLTYSKQLYENSIKDIKNKNQYLLEIESIHIKNNIESMRRTAQMVISDYDFIEYIKTRDVTHIDQLIDYKLNAFSNVAKLQNNNPVIEHIRLFTNNPYVTEMWPIVFHEKRIAQKAWLPEVIERNGTELWWFETHDEDVLNRYYPFFGDAKISLLREIDYPEDEHLGVIEISMLLENFFPKMYSEVNDGISAMLIYDRNMNVYKNEENTFFQQHPIDFERIKQNLHKKSDKQSSFQVTYQGTPYLIVYSFIPEIESYMLNVISLEDSLAGMKITRNIILVGTFLLVGILSIITYVLISYLLKRLYRLIELMKKVEKGDFTVDVDVKGYGEIAQLAHHFRRMLNKINELIAEKVNKQASTKEAELRALKTQIDSHFLYNTLENIKMMAEIDEKYEIADSLTSLGEMMRYNLKWKRDFVVLQEEISHIKNYIDLMNLRLDGRLLMKLDIPIELNDQEILKMSLQPIVENSVKHGISPIIYKKIGVIEVRATYESNDVIIEIKDNGIGMTNEALVEVNEKIRDGIQEHDLDQYSGGIGLRNVHERIQLYYGQEYGVKVESVEGQYTNVIVNLPCQIMKGVRKHV
ncbi:histidine kinase [Bacillus timonensis]|nr:histidine kinase [Bacillus timonensis]